jgi:predicted secreted hydrolase
MRKLNRTLLTVIVGLLIYPLYLYPAGGEQSAPLLNQYLRGEEKGFARALTPIVFSFDRDDASDHGSHPDFKHEWWYFTGNLKAHDGRAFGYQFTIFRNALAPFTDSQSDNSKLSTWRNRQIYMGHFAISDIAEETFYGEQTLARPALGLSGATVTGKKLNVWLHHWQIASLNAKQTFPLRLNAMHKGFGIDLILSPDKPMVLQGDRGLSQKSAEPGNASYYYSYTRLATNGTITVGAQQFEVTGSSWFDREWSSSSLSQEQEGWDWFALQFDHGEELMFYQLRRKDGSVEPLSSGSWVGFNGDKTLLGINDVQVEVLKRWTSPDSNISYPSQWRLRYPEKNLSIIVTPLMHAQEWLQGIRYWEGAVKVEGRLENRTVTGVGYVELAGYR